MARRLAGWVARLAVAGLAIDFARTLWQLATASDRLPQWDMAKYGASGLRLADAIRDLDLVGFLHGVHTLSVWPPTWPLVEAAAFLGFGDGFGVARGLVAVTWGLMICALAWALAGLDAGETGPPGAGLVAGVLAATWVAASPFVQAFGTLILLEVPGLLLLVVALGCAVRAISTESERWWHATWLASALLFFCKYNYGLLWLVPLGVAERVRRSGGWRRAAERLLNLARAVRWTPWTLFVTSFLSVLVAVRLLGGVDTEVLGVQVRMTSIGNPAYGLFVLVLLREAVRWLRSDAETRRRTVDRWRAADAASHGAVRWLLAPIALWMLLPPHMKEFFGFVENRSSGMSLWSLETWTFYPEIFVGQYAATEWLGWATLALAACGLWWLRSDAAPGLRLVALTTAVSWAALFAHPYKLPRFAFQAVALTACLASLVLVVAAGALVRRIRGGRRSEAWTASGSALALALAVCAVVAAWRRGPDLDTVAREHELRSVDAAVAQVVDVAAMTALDGGVVLGTWNLFSPSLVEWRGRQLAEPDARWRPGDRRDLDRRADPVRLIAALERSGCPLEKVAWVESDHRSWWDENGWMTDVRAALDTSPRWRLVDETVARTADGFVDRVRVYACAEPERVATDPGRR